MNMLDTKKCFRGVLLWREDVIKCATVLKKPLSEYVRNLIHDDMAKYQMDDKGRDMLAFQIGAAVEARKNRPKLMAKGKRNRNLTVDVMNIPQKVRKSAKFVKD